MYILQCKVCFNRVIILPTKLIGNIKTGQIGLEENSSANQFSQKCHRRPDKRGRSRKKWALKFLLRWLNRRKYSESKATSFILAMWFMGNDTYTTLPTSLSFAARPKQRPYFIVLRLSSSIWQHFDFYMGSRNRHKQNSNETVFSSPYWNVSNLVFPRIRVN